MDVMNSFALMLATFFESGKKITRYPIEVVAENFEEDFKRRRRKSFYAWIFGTSMIIDLSYFRDNLYGFIIGNKFECKVLSSPSDALEYVGDERFTCVALDVPGIPHQAGAEYVYEIAGEKTITYRDSEGKLHHNDNEPSFLLYKNGELVLRRTYNHGFLQSFYGKPSEYSVSPSENEVTLKWHENGKISRKGDYAMITENKSSHGRVVTQYYNTNGELRVHRRDVYTGSPQKLSEVCIRYFDGCQAKVVYTPVTQASNRELAGGLRAIPDDPKCSVINIELNKLFKLSSNISYQHLLSSNPDLPRGYFFDDSGWMFSHINSPSYQGTFEKEYPKFPRRMYVASEYLVYSTKFKSFAKLWSEASLTSWWFDGVFYNTGIRYDYIFQQGMSFIIPKRKTEISKRADAKDYARHLLLTDIKFLTENAPSNPFIVLVSDASKGLHIPLLHDMFKEAHFMLFDVNPIHVKPSARVMVFNRHLTLNDVPDGSLLISYGDSIFNDERILLSRYLSATLLTASGAKIKSLGQVTSDKEYQVWGGYEPFRVCATETLVGYTKTQIKHNFRKEKSIISKFIERFDPSGDILDWVEFFDDYLKKLKTSTTPSKEAKMLGQRYFLFSGREYYQEHLKEILIENGFVPYPDGPFVKNADLVRTKEDVGISHVYYLNVEPFDETFDHNTYKIKCHVQNLCDDASVADFIKKDRLHERLRDTETVAKTYTLDKFTYRGGFWVMRPSHTTGYSGKGIKFIGSKEEFNKAKEFYEREKTFWSKKTGVQKYYKVIVSEYIVDPICWQGRKFHIRLYGIVTSLDSRFLISRFGKLITASKPFELSNFDDRGIHDTHLGSTPKDLWYPQDFPRQDLLPSLNKQLDDLEYELGSLGVQAKPYTQADKAYMFFGLDLMVRSTGELVLIEINHKVGMKCVDREGAEAKEFGIRIDDWKWQCVKHLFD